MPLVVVQHKTGRVLEDMLVTLTHALPDIVAGALDVPENEAARLTAGDIEVWVQESGKYDVNTKDLEIVIWVTDFPERKKDLERRKDVILQGVRTFLAEYDRNLSGFVWVLLQPTAFGEL